jgi:hypothetical protein
VVEGLARAEPDHGIGDIIRIGKHVLCRNAQDLEAFAFQPFGSDLVPLGSITEIMSGAIHLNRKFGCGAVEVENVWSDRMLPTETHLSAAKSKPQQLLRQR